MIGRCASRSIAALALLAGLAACGGSSDATAPAPRLQSLHVAGGSYVTLGSSVLDITASELKYVRMQGPTVDADFRGPISAADFQRLATLVDTADLTKTLGQRTGISAPCRASDVNISIVTDKARHDFVIPGGETCGAAASPAYLQLNALTSELIAKYVPAAAGS